MALFFFLFLLLSLAGAATSIIFVATNVLSRQAYFCRGQKTCFTLYSQPLSDLICRHECDYYKYADGTQLSKGAPPDQFQSLILCDIQTCIESLVDWMHSNKLKLSAEKTEVLPVASTSRLSSVGRDSVDIGGKRMPFKSSVRNLGVHLDQTLSMQQHISSVCREAYLELRRIASI